MIDQIIGREEKEIIVPLLDQVNSKGVSFYTDKNMVNEENNIYLTWIETNTAVLIIALKDIAVINWIQVDMDIDSALTIDNSTVDEGIENSYSSIEVNSIFIPLDFQGIILNVF